MTSVWLVRDWEGVEHRVMRDKGFFYGYENMCNCVEDKPSRPLIQAHLLVSIGHNPEMGEWAGFSWIQD
jgi:hypothetical protein